MVAGSHDLLPDQTIILHPLPGLDDCFGIERFSFLDRLQKETSRHCKNTQDSQLAKGESVSLNFLCHRSRNALFCGVLIVGR